MQKRYLWLVYYHEKLWHQQHHVYTTSLKAFGLRKQVMINDKADTLWVEAAPHQFMAFIRDKKDNITWAINQEGLVRRYNLLSDE